MKILQQTEVSALNDGELLSQYTETIPCTTDPDTMSAAASNKQLLATEILVRMRR